MTLTEILKHSQIVPVITIEDSALAVPLAKAILDGGIHAIEITLRTKAAIQSIEKIRKEVPKITVGAGTVIFPQQFEQVKNAGAQFIVSPGLTETLANAGIRCGLPYLPGAVTTSEIIAAHEWGFETLKFFPAGLSGGVKALKAFGTLFPSIKFCPTGDVTIENMTDYLSLTNVIAIGGSWLAPKALIEAEDWVSVSNLVREANHIPTPSS